MSSRQQSPRYLASLALFGVLQDAFALLPADPQLKLERNPRNPFTRRDGERIVWLADDSDGWIDEKAGIGKRRFTFVLGVINRSQKEGANADADADLDFQTAAQALRDRGTKAAGDALALIGAQLGGALVEHNTTFQVEGVEVDGALNLAAWHIEYFRPKPAR